MSRIASSFGVKIHYSLSIIHYMNIEKILWKMLYSSMEYEIGFGRIFIFDDKHNL